MARFSGTFVHQTDVNYNQFLKAINVTWLDRTVERWMRPCIVIEDEHRSKGFLVFHEKSGSFTPFQQAKITLGEEYVETLPNGEIAKAVTVQEGEHNLITRIKRAQGDNIEIRYEFSNEGLKYIILMTDTGLEATRFYLRKS